MNGFAIDPVWYSKCLCRLIFFRNAFSHRLHLCSSSCVCVLWWSCIVRLRLKLQIKGCKLLHKWKLVESKYNFDLYPNPQILHLYGRWSECTVICVKSPPRWWNDAPHNSQVNFRTAETVNFVSEWHINHWILYRWLTCFWRWWWLLYSLWYWGIVTLFYMIVSLNVASESFSAYVALYGRIINVNSHVNLQKLASFESVQKPLFQLFIFLIRDTLIGCKTTYDLWHIQHSYGLSLEWTLTCSVNVHLNRNLRPQCLHTYGNFSGSCVDVSIGFGAFSAFAPGTSSSSLLIFPFPCTWRRCWFTFDELYKK